MYTLDRTQKLKTASILFFILFFVASIFGFMKGGYEVLQYDFMNSPFYSILMVAAFGVSLVFLFLYFVIRAIQKDIAEHLRYLSETKGN